MNKRRVEKAYEITDAKISFVSLVDKAANKRQFLITKEKNGKAAFTSYGRIVKSDSKNHYVTGVVYEPMVEDIHGNYMTEEEIIKAAYWYAKNGDKVDIQHSFESFDGAVVVENWVAKSDFYIENEKIKKGTWLMTVEVADESVWDDIEKGKITGFSMGGLGNYSEEDTNLKYGSRKAESIEDKKGLLAKMAGALGLKVVEKGVMSEIYEERSRGTLFWDALNTLQECLYHYDNVTGHYIYERDEVKLREVLSEFCSIIEDLLTNEENVTQALEEVEEEVIVKAFKNKNPLFSIYESLGSYIKGLEEPEAEDENAEEEKDKKEDLDDDEEKEEKKVTKADVECMVSAAIQKAIHSAAQEPITKETIQEMIETAVNKAVDPVLKAKGLPSNLGANITKSEKAHYLHGIL